MSRPAITRSGLLFLTLACVLAMWLGAGISRSKSKRIA